LKNFIYLILLTSFFISFEALAKNCQEVRMGFDIGSGTTKVLVAKVDFCESKIIEVLFTDSRPVSFNEDLEKSKDDTLSPAIIEQGLKTLAGMVRKGKIYKPKKTYGVATSVFRKAHNGANVIRGYSKKLNLKLEVISQHDEALLGFLSARSFTNEKNIVVWDIGGGSMQMWSQHERDKPKTYLGDLASVTFKNMVIEAIQLKDPNNIISPNPMVDKREQAVALARAYAKIHVPADLKIAIGESKIVGIGGVHSQSIKKQLQLKGMIYTLDELDKAGKVQSEKSDKDLEGEYRTTDVTNLLLVQGFMEGLGIKEVTIVNASLLQGAILK
jgi:exopolyphosphatase/guanosine-5'-triphosphate,3'-diphosphate pyrophosphatase